MLLVGDIHGEWENLADRLRQRNTRSTTLLQVGDLGVGFSKKTDERQRLERLDRALDMRDLTLYAIRGNHDDPAYFAPEQEQRWERIHFVPDYTLLTIDRQRVLCVGGAISIDRRHRQAGITYWRDEGFVFDPTTLHAMDLSDVSAVVTHTAPSFAPPLQWGSLVWDSVRGDPALAEDLNAERSAMDALYEAVTVRCAPRWWAYGHFHARATARHAGTAFLLLDVAEMREIPNDGDR
jgi:hypothetical protein